MLLNTSNLSNPRPVLLRNPNKIIIHSVYNTNSYSFFICIDQWFSICGS